MTDISVMIKTMKKIILILGCLSFLISCQTASNSTSSQNETAASNKIFDQIEMRYSYKNLKINDLDQMMDLMYEKNREYKKTDQIIKLKEGALIAFSRPNEDRTLDKVISIVKNPLEDNSEWENTVEAMALQSISKITNEKEDPVNQATAGVVLENIIADLRPVFLKQYKTGGFETEIIEKIADSNAMYSKLAKAERRLNLMRTNSSPSEIAIRLIDQKNEALKNDKK